ncbi:MAG: NYN domain-containing protein [Candidatus Spyradocola sp.]|nr:NYN domain-containing protein [Candidatus Spyradocola sp.]
MLYLVDGYNMIGAWPEFQHIPDISQSRELLASMLADFAGFTGDEVMLVFDGYKGDKLKTAVERVAGIDVIFTKRSETADHFIERTVDERMAQLPRFSRQAIRVATSDATEQNVIFTRGAVRIPAKEMRSIVRSAKSAQSGHRQPPRAQNTKTIEDRLPQAVRAQLEQMRREPEDDK